MKGRRQFSNARANARKQAGHALSHAAVLLSRAGTNAGEQLLSMWKRIRAQQIARSNSKRLHVSATASLGEKRFVAVIQVDGREFLVGGGSANVALLAQLDAQKSFNGMLTETMAVPGMKRQPAKRAKKPTAKVTEIGTVSDKKALKKQPARRTWKPIAKPTQHQIRKQA
jgi:flagellar biogenesis protein FliO